MTSRTGNHDALAEELLEFLRDSFDGISVEVARSPRWKRMCATFRWAGFNDLLPEERFHRLSRAIPESFREEKLAGFVWVELAEGESLEDFLKLPRSEDVDARANTVAGELSKVGFFGALKRSLGANPEKKCAGDFAHSLKVLKAAKLPPASAQDARLLFIRHHAYCDCQVLQTVEAALAKRHAAAS